MNKKNYIFSADVIRVIAICGVITIHSLNSVYARLDFFGGFFWWVTTVLDAVSRTAIPFFILLSGLLVLSKDESIKASLKRALYRIALPLIIWEIIYILWNGGNPSLAHLNVGIIQRIFTVNVFDLYFLIILLGLYVLAPLLRSFLQSLSIPSQKRFTFFLIGINILQVIVQFISLRCGSETSFTYFFPYTGLFVAGYVFSKKVEKITRVKTLGAIFLGSIGLTVAGSYIYYFLLAHGNTTVEKYNCLSYYTDYYLSINVVLMSISAFILLLRVNYDRYLSLFAKKIIHSIAQSAFAIYLLHSIVLDIFDSKLHLFDHITPLWAYIIIKWCFIFLLSNGISVVMLKVPFLKFAFGEKRRVIA